MRPRTFLLLILVLLLGAVAVVLVIANSSGSNLLAGIIPGIGDTTDTPVLDSSTTTEGQEPGILPTATPAVRLEPVLVAKVDIPIGKRITPDLINIEMRPDENIALQGGYTFAESEAVLGQITRVDIAEGQAILGPMLALNPTDLSSFGSNLALYIDQGEVAVAFPINQLSGAALAMRPGDLVDVLMTLRVIAIDPEFRTALPNFVQRVIEPDQREGGVFLIEDITPQGRLEFIEEIGQVAEIIPSAIYIEGQDFEPGSPIPKRVTQLTIQQAEVLWVGTWFDQDELVEEEEQVTAQAQAEATASEEEEQVQEPERDTDFCLNPATEELAPCPIIRKGGLTDIVILGLPAQDALALKYALERGLDIDLALRSQGDQTTFVTASVTLPQIVEQGGLNIPPPADFDLHPRPEEVAPPFLPAKPPEGGD